MDTITEEIKKEYDEGLEIKSEEIHFELVKEEIPDDTDVLEHNFEGKSNTYYDFKCAKTELLFPDKDLNNFQSWLRHDDPDEDPLALPETKQETEETESDNFCLTSSDGMEVINICNISVTPMTTNSTVQNRADNLCEIPKCQRSKVCVSNGQATLLVKCSECSFTTTKEKYLRTHLLRHKKDRGDTPFKCAECSYTAVRAFDLKSHMLRHRGEMPHKCMECDYSSVRSDKLKEHMMRHRGELPFKCTECNYSSVTSNNLKQHMLKHREPLFKCTECNYTTVKSAYLKNHMFLHSGEKPFKCTDCKFATVRIDRFKKHIMRHFGEKPLKCMECISAVRQGKLKEHLLKHKLK